GLKTLPYREPLSDNFVGREFDRGPSLWSQRHAGDFPTGFSELNERGPLDCRYQSLSERDPMNRTRLIAVDVAHEREQAGMPRAFAERAVRVEPQHTIAGLKRRLENISPFKVAGRMCAIDRSCLSPQVAGAVLITSRIILGRARASGRERRCRQGGGRTDELLGVGDRLGESNAVRALDEIDEVAAETVLVVVPLAGLRAIDHHRQRALAAKAQFSPAREWAIGFSQQRYCDLRGTSRQRISDGRDVETGAHGISSERRMSSSLPRAPDALPSALRVKARRKVSGNPPFWKKSEAVTAASRA